MILLQNLARASMLIQFDSFRMDRVSFSLGISDCDAFFVHLSLVLTKVRIRRQDPVRTLDTSVAVAAAAYDSIEESLVFEDSESVVEAEIASLDGPDSAAVAEEAFLAGLEAALAAEDASLDGLEAAARTVFDDSGAASTGGRLDAVAAETAVLDKVLPAGAEGAATKDADDESKEVADAAAQTV